MSELLPDAWRSRLQSLTDDPRYAILLTRVAEAREAGIVYPPEALQFSAFRLTRPEKVRAVILGQDPYHEEGQAMGLSFSVPDGAKLPPSLRNIYKERESDLGIPPSENGDLTAWAEQGVLLLNTVLTVEEGKANSHSRFGWQWFTDGVVQSLSSLPQPIAFILWGAQAWKKEPLTVSEHPRLVLKSAHPSPLSAYRGFFGSRPFSAVNAFLTASGESPIDWRTERREGNL